jgi:hypothetical protein
MDIVSVLVGACTGATGFGLLKHFVLDPKAHAKEAHRQFVALCSFRASSVNPKGVLCDTGVQRAADMFPLGGPRRRSG